MSLTVEELLYPRFMVLTDSPGVSFKQGDILICNMKVGEILFCDLDAELHTDELRKYPKVFEEIPWFGGRTLEDMPDYVSLWAPVDVEPLPGKHVNYWGVEYWKIYKVTEKGELKYPEYNIGQAQFYCCLPGFIKKMNYCYFKPRTQQEYDEYILKQQQPVD